MNKVKKTIYNMIRNKLLKRMTNNLGEIIEEEDKIICNVSLVKLHKLLFNNLCHDLIVHGNTIMDKQTKELYKLNKPVHFIIKDECFMNHLSVVASTTVDFTFENCKFNEELSIKSAGNVVLKNNIYNTTSLYRFDNFYFFAVNANSLTFDNDNFINEFNRDRITKFGMNINVDSMKINKTNINIDKNGLDICIKTKKLDIKDSIIYCDDAIVIIADEINTENSMVESKTSIEIVNKNSNNIIGFKSPQTIYNYIDVSKTSNITKESCELTKIRHTLIDRLKEIRDFCDDINIEQLEKKENELYNQNVYKLINK